MEHAHAKSEKVVINKDMLMGEILEVNQATAGIMEKFGLHCFGCGGASFETLEQGMLGHGGSPEDVELLVKELNDFLANPTATGHDHGHDHSHADSNAEIVPLKITPIAVTKLIELRDSDASSKGQGVRVMVTPGGCSGYRYGMDFEKAPQKDDVVLQFGGLKVYLDVESYKMLSGVEVDFVNSLQESGFKFNNPGAHSTCGCGSSFN